MMTLFDWQKPLALRLAWMCHNNAYNLVALPTGSGKTFISCQVLKKLGITPLVICPKSAISTWKNVCAGFELTPLGIVNWEKLKTGKTGWLKRDDNLWKWNIPAARSILLIDEVHKGCSGPETEVGLAVALLKRQGIKALMMSATVASNPMQMRHTGFLLSAHNWARDSFFGWCKRHGCRFDAFLGRWVLPKGESLVEQMGLIRKEISDKILYLPVDKIPGFPTTLIEPRLYDFSTRDTAEINRAYTEMSEELKRPGRTELAELGKVRHRVELLKIPLFSELVQDTLETGTSAVVFLNYKDSVRSLCDQLASEGISNVSTLTGDSTVIERQDAITAFQTNKNHVFICTSAGGTAISLHDVLKSRPRVSFISPTYNASDFRQSLGRIVRVEGTHTVQTIVLAAGTLEERIHKTISVKLNALDTLNDSDFRVG